MTAATEAYVRELLAAEGVEAGDRVEYVIAEMKAGRPWHPKRAGELRVALTIMGDAIKGPWALEALALVGEVLEEDCLP